ncbi:MAG: hypothetical protein HQM08_26780 [Candidatus Riflebacteria bacterium]|nr:hypothetical protein [Candidatus Riflebacteria bacterium]
MPISLLEIARKIEENAKTASYSNVVVSDRNSSKSKVGIWWWLKGKVIKLEDTIENCEESEPICVSQEHIKVWPFVQQQFAEEIPETLDATFQEVERGRVWAVRDKTYPTRISYIITCSTPLTQNSEAISAIKQSFGIAGSFVSVRAQPCLYDREIKLK